MRLIATELEELIYELAEVLENDIEHIENTISILNDLRGGVIKRDANSLEQLLTCIAASQNNYNHNETRREQIRSKSAVYMQCKPAEVTLSKIVEYVDGPAGIRIASKKARLYELVAKLKAEYLSTVSMITECSRFNQKLLNSIISGHYKGTGTYTSAGVMNRHNKTGIVNMQF